MATISYSQNLEDVMLQRALGHIRRGFYVDVGAYHPEIDSVTKAFYDRGWRGINIEPEKRGADYLKQARPDDLNLQVVIGEQAGVRLFHQIEGTGLSTANTDLAEKAAADHGFAIDSIQLPCLTLTDVLREHAERPIHFLKVDVEGAESQVLNGLDLDTIRPWVVLVEATEPCSQIENHQQWESLLTDNGYSFVFADGLNRYYVADEHAELCPAFRYPPNVFDEVVSHRLVHLATLLRSDEAAPTPVPSNQTEYFETVTAQVISLQARLQASSSQLEHAREESAALDEEKNHAWHVAAGLERRLHDVTSCWTWKLTGPFRELRRTVHNGLRMLDVRRWVRALRSSPAEHPGGIRREGRIRRSLRKVEQEVRRVRKRWSRRKLTPRTAAPGLATSRQEHTSTPRHVSARLKRIQADLQQAVNRRRKAA